LTESRDDMCSCLTFQEAQQASFQTLVQLNAICNESHCTYALAYGTLIGAIREHGLIPWDDDIDIMMPRADYDRLKEIFLTSDNMVGNLSWVDFYTTKNYPHAIARISDNRYRLVFDNEEDYKIGAFVDIYPFDNVGDEVDEAVKLLAKTKRLAQLCFLSGRKKFGRDNTRSAAKMIAKIPAYAMAKVIGTKRFIEQLNDLCGSLAKPDGKYVACSLWPAGDSIPLENKVFPATLFETMTCSIEGETFPIPREYDEFLSKTYGDYMHRPDPKDRTTNHMYSVYRL
jgi:lipopolysaccharide cholinephosphotransferase